MGGGAKQLTFPVGKDQIPAVGLGTWKSESGDVGKAVVEAIKCGYKHIDCAAAYNNEDEVGRALQEAWTTTAVKREEVWITSKLWNDFHKAEDVEKACRKSLEDLQLSYLDLYLIHWPVTGNKGPTLDPPIEETWHAMEKLVEKGLVKNIGVSNFSRKKLKELLSYAKIRPAVNQVEAHPYFMNRLLFEYCQSEGIHVTAYSPMGSPDSADMLERKGPVLLEDDRLKAIAEKVGKSTGQVLIRWAVQRGTSTIPKSVHAERIRSNLEVFDWSLSDEDMKALSSFNENTRQLGPKFFLSEEGPYKTADDVWDGDDE